MCVCARACARVRVCVPVRIGIASSNHPRQKSTAVIRGNNPRRKSAAINHSNNPRPEPTSRPDARGSCSCSAGDWAPAGKTGSLGSARARAAAHALRSAKDGMAPQTRTSSCDNLQELTQARKGGGRGGCGWEDGWVGGWMHGGLQSGMWGWGRGGRTVRSVSGTRVRNP